MMKKNIAVLLLMLSSHILFAQDDIFKASWMRSPVKIDGNGEEWSQPLRYYDEDTKLFFAFANDDKDLYLCFQTNDNMNQMKIMLGGMEISIAVKGEHKATIDFPLEQNTEVSRAGTADSSQQKIAAEPANENNTEKKLNRGDPKRAFLSQNTMMEVKGFITKNGMIPINDSSGINAAINWDQANKFVYEISIPLKELFGADYTAADIVKHISLGVKINAMKGQAHSRPSSGDNNFSGKSGGRMGGGGRTGGGMHHNHEANADEENTEEIKEDKTELFKKTTFKQKFILAQK